jgi:hypothetical protein
MSKISIQDDSGDKKYFTIIPNYILNHSTIWDRAVYIQMKRITGEDGTCWTSKPTLAKQCGMSKRRLDKSILYLLEHKWIEQLGMKTVVTKGGAQEVNEYKITDLWDLNNTFYQEKFKEKGGAPNALPNNKGGAQKTQRGCTDEAKGGAPGAYKEEPLLNKNPIKEEQSKAVALQGKEVSILIKEFETLNPVGSIYGNSTERLALEKMASMIGYDKLLATIKALPDIVCQPYAPKITKPTELKRDFGKLLLFVKQHKLQVGKYQAKSINI